MKYCNFILTVYDFINWKNILNLYYDTEEEVKAAMQIIETGLDHGKKIRVEKYGEGEWIEYDVLEL